MAFRIVIAGKLDCQLFAEVCLLADYLSRELPTFCYERIEKPTLEWQSWLLKLNITHQWSHIASPIVWKEVLCNGSKPYYIGGASEFFEYCHAYYNFDFYFDRAVFGHLKHNNYQFRRKLKCELDYPVKIKPNMIKLSPDSPKTEFRVCIYGGGQPLTIPLISSLVEIYINKTRITKIYVFDYVWSESSRQAIMKGCEYLGHALPGKTIKYIEKVHLALKKSDMLIILHHIPFNETMSIGYWLDLNKTLMHQMAHMLNTYVPQRMYIIFANLGPACFNATVLRSALEDNRENVVVATSGLGLDLLQIVSELTSIPVGNIFCPPVWGFVGVNHLVDIHTTMYKYNSFEPYRRYRRVRNSSLIIGSVTPEIRTMEHLVHFEENLWQKVVERRNEMFDNQTHLYKVEAIVNIVKQWVFERDPHVVMSLGVSCDGSFGLTFDGIFSQPCQLKDNVWKPAINYMLPKDPQMNLFYLEGIAKEVMATQIRNFLPPIVEYKIDYRLPVKNHRETIITWNLEPKEERE